MKLFISQNLIKVCSIIFLSLLVSSAHADGGNEGNQNSNMYKARSQSHANEKLVVKFYNKIFNERADVEETALRFMREDYIQHNAFVGTGRQSFIDGIGGFLASIPDTKFEIKRVITDGDLVVLLVHMHVPGDGQPGDAIFEILRVQDGKIAEHWDVQQSIPAFIPHDNGMF